MTKAKALIAVTAGIALLAGFAACGSDTKTVTETVKQTTGTQGTTLSPDLEARFQIADELERRAEKRLIEAETAHREGREAESLSLSAAGESLLERAEEVTADIEKINAEE